MFWFESKVSINGKLYRSLLSKVRNIVTYLDGIFIVHFVIGERETDSRERIERIQEMKSLYYHKLTIDYIIWIFIHCYIANLF